MRGERREAARIGPPPIVRVSRALLVREQLTRLEILWLARSAASEFEKTRKRARRSITGLRRGARLLETNRPPRPPKPRSIALIDVYNEMRRAFGLPAR